MPLFTLCTGYFNEEKSPSYFCYTTSNIITFDEGEDGRRGYGLALPQPRTPPYHNQLYCVILGFSKCWICGIFNIQIQSDRGHKLMLFMFQNKDKDLLGIYQYGCDPFCVSLLTDRHLKLRSNSILFTFSNKGALTSARHS